MGFLSSYSLVKGFQALKKLFSRVLSILYKPVAPNPDYATECAEQIKTWLQECVEDHSNECNKSGSSILPKRLIFFEDDQNFEHLVAVDKLEELPQYIALSYCWGREENFTTEPSNLREMEREIPRDRLPRTLKDVFSMVRKLNFRYLWIDALCIVQDAHGTEWEEEAAKMGDVYANASLVLTAMASPSVHSGLFVKMENYSEEQKAEFHRIMRTCRTMTQREWHDSLRETYPLLCRGWAFQERMLARRTVHFTVMELIWECMGDRWCQCEDKSKDKDLSGKINNMNWALKECRAKPDDAKIRLMWRECVKSFSRRDLTMLTDRLFAIDGIASYIRAPDPTAYNNQYFYGLWKDALPWDLLWYCDQTSYLKSEKSRAPSYCWSSVDCGIEWPTCDHWLPTEKFSWAISTGTCFEFRFTDEMAPKGTHFCDASVIDDDTLSIVSRMTPVLVKEQKGDLMKGERSLEISPFIENIKSKKTQTLPFYPDIELEITEHEEDIRYYYVEIASFEYNTTVRQAGLVVRPKPSEKPGEQSELYERIGIAGDILCNLQGICSGWLTGDERHEIVLV